MIHEAFLKMELIKNQIIECTCEDMTVDGQGVCKYASLVIFVKDMLIGEKAKVKIIAQKPHLAYGIIDELLIKSLHRIIPDCPIAFKCGGCDLRHVDYLYGLKLKKQLLEQTFNYTNRLNVKVEDITPSQLTDYYRNKVQIPYRDHQIGFYRKHSNDIMPFEHCLIQSAVQNAIIDDLKILFKKYHIDDPIRHIIIKEGFNTHEVMVALIVKTFAIPDINALVAELVNLHPEITSFILNEKVQDDNVVLGDKEKVLYGSAYIIDSFAGLEFEIALKSFYQVNYHQMVKLYETIVKIGHLKKDDSILDLYSGIGTISLYLSRYVKKVIGVEIVPSAVENAIHNAKRNQIRNVSFVLGDVKHKLHDYLKDIDAVIVDPPRKGLHPDVVLGLIASEVDRIVYISCNPATLARDLNLFAQGGYHFDTVYPFDMFPHTMHVECLVLLERVL